MRESARSSARFGRGGFRPGWAAEAGRVPCPHGTGWHSMAGQLSLPELAALVHRARSGLPVIGSPDDGSAEHIREGINGWRLPASWSTRDLRECLHRVAAIPNLASMSANCRSSIATSCTERPAGKLPCPGAIPTGSSTWTTTSSPARLRPTPNTPAATSRGSSRAMPISPDWPAPTRIASP